MEANRRQLLDVYYKTKISTIVDVCDDKGVKTKSSTKLKFLLNLE